MQVLWRTLLLIALCVQMPLSAMASYATSASHDKHHHSHSAEAQAHSAHTVDHDESSTLADCAAGHHHCTASHLSLMVQTHVATSIISQRESFDVRAQPFSPTDLILSIERPKWVSI